MTILVIQVDTFFFLKKEEQVVDVSYLNAKNKYT
jgi:hypothetical protein